MTLITCLECSREVSERASTCPACGYPMAPPEQSALDSVVAGVTNVFGCGVAILALVIVAAIVAILVTGGL